MPFRKSSGKKYNGIYEYYRSNDPDKKTVAYYISYRDETGKATGKVKTEAISKEDALQILNSKKGESVKARKIKTSEKETLQNRVKNDALIFDEMAALYYSERTAKNNHRDKRRYQNHLSPLIGKKKVSKFNTSDVIKLQKDLLGKKITKPGEDDGRTLSPKTVDNIIDQLKAMFNEGMRDKNGWCSHNPAADKDVKKITQDEDKARLRIFTDEELGELFELAKTNPRMYLFFQVMYYTAARPEAIISLQVKDINFSQNKIHLKAMKKAKAYSVPMADAIIPILKEWIKEHDLKYSHFIFYPMQTGDKTKPAIYENFRRSSRALMESFNEDVPVTDRKNRATLYTLRHTAATKLVRKLGIKVAKEYLNHSDLKVTEIYTKVGDTELQEAANAL